MKKEIKTNNAGFVVFAKRNWSYKGDKGTWAKVTEDDNGKKLTVLRAKNGIISSDYSDEITAFCSEYGIDFSDLASGEKIEVNL